MRILLLVFVAMLTFSVSYEAVAVKKERSQDLSDWCAQREKGLIGQAKFGFCLGYLQGFANSLSMSASAAKSGEDVPCLPNEYSIKELMEVFDKWLKDHQHKIHEPYYLGVFAAFKRAFPCKK